MEQNNSCKACPFRYGSSHTNTASSLNLNRDPNGQLSWLAIQRPSFPMKSKTAMQGAPVAAMMTRGKLDHSEVVSRPFFVPPRERHSEQQCTPTGVWHRTDFAGVGGQAIESADRSESITTVPLGFRRTRVGVMQSSRFRKVYRTPKPRGRSFRTMFSQLEAIESLISILGLTAAIRAIA